MAWHSFDMPPMTVTPASPTLALAAQAAPRLRRRLVELRAMLEAAAQGEPQGVRAAEVVDFKDLAAADLRARVDEVTCEHAAAEIGQVLAALRRIAEGSYGLCVDCGEEIDARRLQALPATPFCTGCQAAHERERNAWRRARVLNS